MFHSIVLAYDGSPDGREALKQGVDLAAVCSAQVYLVAVIDIFSSGMTVMEGPVFFSEQQQSEVEETLSKGLDYLQMRGLSARAQVRYGDPAEQITHAAKEIAADLIVVGHRDQKAWERWWNGSVGISVLRHAPCSLLVVVPTHERKPGNHGTKIKILRDRKSPSNVVALERHTGANDAA